MAYHWIPPPVGVIKINVHGTSSRTQSIHGHRTGIGAAFRDSDGALEYLTIGAIPQLSPLGNQLWAIFIALRRAFILGYRDVILETDNLEAFLVVKNFHLGAPPGVYHLAAQIDIRLRDTRWFCMIAYVVPSRNKVARFLSRLGKKTCDVLYTCCRPVGGVEELLDWDMGMGIDDPAYQDIIVPADAPSPVNMEEAELISDQTEEYGLGQIDAPTQVGLDRETDANDMMELEEVIHGGIFAAEKGIFMGDSPMAAMV